MAGLSGKWFLRRNNQADIAGWRVIYDHLVRILGQSGEKQYEATRKGGNYTVIKYKSLSVVVHGKIAADELLYTLAKWEVSMYSNCHCEHNVHNYCSS